ncbi:MAG TPA: hypothetical protein VHN37_15065 [Actinomycetota bacterium]|nr:hypothetical protein [Actinomycetota bacterium]
MDASGRAATVRWWIVGVVAVASLCVQTVWTAPPLDAAPTPTDRVKIWTANLNQYENSPEKLIDNIQAQYNRPDFVALSGLDANQLNEFKHELQNRFDGADSRPVYLALHGTTPNNTSDARSNVGLIWDSARFTRTAEVRWLDLLREDSAGNCEIIDDAAETAADDEDSKYQLGVKFKDTKNNDRSTVVASIHINRHGPVECDEENVARIHNRLEELSPTRRLTLVAGDFNMSPRRDDKDCADQDADNKCDALPEATQDCWYRNFSAVGATCDPDPSQEHSYVDTVAVEAKATSATAICAQWTRARDSRDVSGNPGVYDTHSGSDYCHDYLDDDGHAPGSANYDAPGTEGNKRRRDKNRIDYIWVRWEDGSGNAVTAPVDTIAEAAAKVVQASVDTSAPNPGNPAVRYSDHRGVHAAVPIAIP